MNSFIKIFVFLGLMFFLSHVAISVIEKDSQEKIKKIQEESKIVREKERKKREGIFKEILRDLYEY